MNQNTGKADQWPAPRIIPRSEHSLSRKNISKGALRVLYRLHDAGYRACLVGGAVRDLLLGVEPKDFDVATDATPEQVRHLFRNCRLIGRRFRLAHVMFGREIVEVATFRGFGDGNGDGNEARRTVDGRLVRDNVWGRIEEDALRRDFRVNALYYDIADFSVIDYVGGMRDLDDRVLRLIGDPEQRYREDPVRMLRAARLAAKLEFTIDEAAREPFARLSGLLADAPPARLFDESLKLFMSGRAADSFHALERLDLLKVLFPAVVRQLGHGEPTLREMVEQGLANTDRRVAEGRPVTPAFLFAVLLWGEMRVRVQAMIDEGMDPSLAWQRAGSRVVSEQARHVAIPRRFSCAMQEIWMLQPRFTRRTRKRTFRLLEHPRFRAAYDFLLLRGVESEQLEELGAWWTRAQELPPSELAAQLGHGGVALPEPGPAPAPSPSPAPSTRRRRRGGRGRRRKSSSPEA